MTLIDPHLDVDQVSAAVDGERDPAVAAHLLVCLSCREQVDAWRRVLSSLNEMPALAPEVLDRMVDRALGDAPGQDAKPLAPAAAKAPRLRRWTVRPAVQGVAAALAAAVLVTATALGLHVSAGQSGSMKGAAATASGRAASLHAAPSSTGAAASARTPVGPTSAGTAQLTAQLRRLAPSLHPDVLPAATPCLHGATELAAAIPAVAGRSAWFDETVVLGGTAARAFVFDGAAGYVAVVVRAETCSLLATLSF